MISSGNQLLSLTHEIHKAFHDKNFLEVRSVFLDMSKAFDKVWHEGLLCKLQQNGIDGKLLALFSNYLSNRKQRVVLIKDKRRKKLLQNAHFMAMYIYSDLRPSKAAACQNNFVAMSRSYIYGTCDDWSHRSKNIWKNKNNIPNYRPTPLLLRPMTPLVWINTRSFRRSCDVLILGL